MPNFVSRLLRFVLKLVLAAFGLVLAASLLAAALIVEVLSILKSLIIGKKPAPSVVFGRFQKFSPAGMWPGESNREDASRAAGTGEVVDVEVREISDDQHLPGGIHECAPRAFIRSSPPPPPPQ